MSWSELELDDWFKTHLPGEGLPSLNNLLWSSFKVDLASEHSMATGVKDGLQNLLKTAGCHDLEVCPTNLHPDSTSQATRVSPRLGIYSASRSDPDVEKSTSSSGNSIESFCVCYGSLEVPVGVRHGTVECSTASSDGNPPINTLSSPISILSESPPLVTSTSRSQSSTSTSSSEAYPWEHWGEMMEDVVELFNRQHRLFVWAILFVNEKARLLRFNRTEVSMTSEFNYARHSETIGKFLHRISRSRDAMGHDPTATRANEADTAMFRTLHTRYHPQSTVARCLKNAAMDDWPVYTLTIEGGFSPDGTSAVRRDAHISRREYLVGRPTSVRRFIFWRGTRVYVAYDVATKQIVVIKDSWRPNSRRDIRSEYDTYLLLTDVDGQEAPTEIPTLLGGGDVVYRGAMQETQASDPELLTRVHFRLVFKEVCRPLEDFVDSLELVGAITSALGAHYVAWTAAHVLHRDISVGNILIFDKNPEEPPDPETSKGLLADWELARTKAELDDPNFAPTQPVGTWPFISARLQHAGPEQQRHALSDDLESFVHVLNYCALKHLPNTLNLSSEKGRVAKFISDVYDYSVRAHGGLGDRGSYEKLDLLVNNRPFVNLCIADHPLTSLLSVLSDLCWRHYHHIQFPPPQPEPLCPPSSREAIVFVSQALESLLIPPDGDGTVPDPPALLRLTAMEAERALPEADPDQSPLKDHIAIGNAFLSAVKPRDGLTVRWPSDKIKGT